MKIFRTGGTLGDTYTICCKLTNIKEKIKIIHIQPYPKYNESIRKIYSLVPNIVELSLINSNKYENLDILPFPKDIQNKTDFIKMNYFPQFEFKSKFKFDLPYIVLQPKSGREEQNRELYLSTIKKIIKKSKYRVVLIGNSKKYEKVKNCINLINKTNLFDAFKIIQNSKYFIGFFGIMTMVALSNKINSNFLYTSEIEKERRILGTPWEKYCKNICLLKNYLDSVPSFKFQFKRLILRFYGAIYQYNKQTRFSKYLNKNSRIKIILSTWLKRN